MSSEGRERLLRGLHEAQRASVGQSVLFHHAVAARVGINATDLNCLNVLEMHGPLTAGQLAEHTGLTRGGAITAAIDRLEGAGLLARERDPGDRRRIIVRLLPEAVARIAPLMPSDVWDELCADYADDQLALVLEFTRRSNKIVQGLVERLAEE